MPFLCSSTIEDNFNNIIKEIAYFIENNNISFFAYHQLSEKKNFRKKICFASLRNMLSNLIFIQFS